MTHRSLSALYPGSFDALTYGHLDIITRGAQIFDKLTVAIATNAQKKPIFTIEERLSVLKEEVGHMVSVEISTFDNLTVEFATRIGAKVIIRGLRVASDFEYELQMALMNRQMESSVETLFLAPSAQTLFVSSSLVKEILVQGGNIDQFVPPATERMLRAKYGIPRKT